MSIELRLPPFQMYVGKLEEGSPAEKCGKLKTGQKIESINGEVLKDIDPRIQLAKIITRAEATDGKIVFSIKENENLKPTQVVIEIPVLGSYSKTWPLNCKKSDRIVRDMAHWIKENNDFTLDTKSWASLNGFSMLFMLSTGNGDDLDVVKGWIKKVVEQYKDETSIKLKPWVFGPAAIPLAEYYLRTGDKSILPTIQKIVKHVEGTMYNGAWSGRGGLVFGYMNGGHMNAAGVHGPTFLMLAKECGVDVDEKILLESLAHFYRFSGKGSLSYGDGFPETYFIDNGKTGALAFTMAAAAALTPGGEKSVYAKARDISALRGFYGTNYMLVGHTGGGIGEVWRGPAMGFLYEKEPGKYRAFMDGRQWHLEMSRRFDGSFSMISGSSRYNSPKSWSQMMAFQYTVPRKTLRLTGAPRNKWSKPYTLPQRPWGTAADDDFCKIKPATHKDGSTAKYEDTLEEGTINGIERHFRKVKRTDELITKYCYHPEHEIRREIGAGYRGPEQDKYIVPMLKHLDARVRRTALSVIHRVHKGTHVLPKERLTDEMMELVIAMVNDPNESWWVVENALRAMSLAPIEKTAPHLDRLLSFLNHSEWWLQHASLSVLAPLVSDKRYYKKILSAIEKVMINNTHLPLMGGFNQITEKLNSAPTEIQNAAREMFKLAYAKFPNKLIPPAGVNSAKVLLGDMDKYVIPVYLRSVAKQILRIPGGFEALYEVAKQRHPDQNLPYKSDYLYADPSSFSPKIKKALVPIILNQLIPEFVTRNLATLKNEINKGGSPHCLITELAGMYKKIDITDYEWKNFGPDRNEMQWHYYSFDPVEKKNWSPGGDRTRKITFPKGMDHWSTSKFDPSKAHWKKGKAPFGQSEGKLKTEKSGCTNPICRCGDAMNTLWEKEVILIKGKFKFPAMKEGHSYRLLFSGVSHVGVGNGPTVYINGTRVASGRSRVRRRQGGRARGVLLSPKYKEVFDGKEIEISAMCHLNMHHRSRQIGGFLTVWLEEMKTPPINEEIALSGLTQIAMQSTQWQQNQDSDVAELISTEGLFTYDGKFVDNPALHGQWVALGKVAKPEDFKPGEKIETKVPRYRNIVFNKNGTTNSAQHYWSSDTMFEIGRLSTALQMKTKTIGKSNYLFVEAGGFTFYHERQTYKHPKRWRCPWTVFVKK